MNYLAVILLLCSVLMLSIAHPNGGTVEIEKQRLIKFPEETFQFQTSKQSEETRRILEEINKININLGYVKKQEPPPQMPTILDSDQYLYPRPAYHPSIHGVALPASIRSLRFNRPVKHRGRFHGYSSAYVRELQYAPESSYYRPNPYLSLPDDEKPRNFNGNFRDEYEIDDPADYRIQLSSPKKLAKLNNIYKIQLVGDFRQIMTALHANQQKSTKASGSRSVLPLIFLPANLRSYDQSDSDVKGRSETSTDKQRKNTKIKDILPLKQHPQNEYQKALTKYVESKKPTSAEAQIKSKTPFGFFSRPPPPQASVTTSSTTTTPTSVAKFPLLLHKKPNSTSAPDDYDDSNEDSLENSDPSEKNLFASFLQNQQAEQKTSLKEGGIIIQRLKVRKGGIAIAGPGGVATAGSGGTAIVGPGGFALTHPRSLTIAGPGAKVIAYPESIDLGDAALKTSQGNLPEGGEVVATGPIVYYNSATG